jgi:YD repeat-containing protein
MRFLAESEEAMEIREAEMTAKRRAEIRRWRVAFASVSALTVLLLVSGAYMYEAYFAEHVRYYKNFVKHFGEPVGIGELSSDQIRHRAASIEIVRKGLRIPILRMEAPVLRMEAIDADGNCAPDNSVGTYLQNAQEVENTSPLHECRWEFVYDDKGEVVYEKAYDREGKLRWGYSYTPGEEQAKSRTAYYVDSDGFPARFKNSLAEIVSFNYDERGYEITKSYSDRKRVPQPGPDRAYGQKHEYDERGVVRRETSVDRSGRKMDDTAGNATMEYTYDVLGNLTDAKALDQNDAPVLLKGDGYCEIKEGYDEDGDVKWTALFDSSGSPTVDKNGVHLTKFEYDEKGYVKAIHYYDTAQNPTVTKEGFYKEVALARDEHGHPLQWAYFGTAGEKTTDAGGVHEYRITYDSRGFQESRAAFDTEGRPTTTKDGYHRIEWHYDQNGNRISQLYFDREGRPTRDGEGWYNVKLAYDDRGNVTEWRNFDAEGRPTMTNDGYHRKTAKYDEAGFKVEETIFGKKDEPIIGKKGYHKAKMANDLRGNIKEISYFDANDDPVNGAEKFARIAMKHDGRDNIVEWAYYGPDYRLTDPGKGYAMLRQEYDDQDRVTKKAYYDDNVRLMAGPDGYAIVRLEYDGTTEYERFYDTGDRQIPRQNCMIYRIILNQRTGEQTEADCLDAERHPVRNTDGAAIIQTKYDEHGREVEKAWYREDWRLESGGSYAIRRKKYDGHGNKVEEAYFGEDQKLRIGSQGYAIFRSKYDDHGNQIEEAYFGDDAKLRVGPTGYAVLRSKYDDHGNQTEIAYFGEDGKLRAHPKDEYAIVRIKYDDSGHMTEVATFGEDEQLQHGSGGYATIRIRYDENGKEIEKAWFGEDEKLRLGPQGYAIFRSKYDDRGNKIEEAYFGEDEKLHSQPDGYAIFRSKYDVRGNMIEIAYFGEDGKPRIHPTEGYATLRMKYDEQDRRTELAFFGPGGALTSSGAGFARVTKEITVQDEQGRLRARCQNNDIADFWNSPKHCSDADDKPLVSRPVILDLFVQSPAQLLGLRTGDIIEAYDGKPVFGLQQANDLIAQPGEGKRRMVVIRQDRRLVFDAPPGDLGIRVGLTFVAADQPSSAKHTSR